MTTDHELLAKLAVLAEQRNDYGQECADPVPLIKALRAVAERHKELEVVDYNNRSGSNVLKYKIICSFDGYDYPCPDIADVEKELL